MPHRTLGDASMRVRKHAEPLRGIWAMLLNTVHHTIARRALLARGGGALAGLALLDSDFANAIPLTLTFAPASIECRLSDIPPISDYCWIEAHPWGYLVTMRPPQRVEDGPTDELNARNR